MSFFLFAVSDVYVMHKCTTDTFLFNYWLLLFSHFHDHEALDSLKFDCLKTHNKTKTKTKHTVSLIKWIVFTHTTKCVFSHHLRPPFHASFLFPITPCNNSILSIRRCDHLEFTNWFVLRQKKIENRVYANRKYIKDDTMFLVFRYHAVPFRSLVRSFLFLLLFLRVLLFWNCHLNGGEKQQQ